MTTDAELLRRYATQNSETAFAELVQRHVALVYSTALRQVGGDTHLAQDVTQTVFTALARKADALLDRGALAGWLYLGAHHAAAQAVRSAQRRRAREQVAHTMQELHSSATPPTDWDRVRPVLDDALRELRADDREAVLLRFFEQRPFADIGAALNVTEDAARMRTERALDKLHALLARRGIKSTGAALTLALANQAMVATPSGLAGTIAGTALASAAAGAKGIAGLTFMKTQTIGAAAVAVFAIGFAVYERNQLRAAGEAQTAAMAELSQVRAQLREAEQDAAKAAQQEASLRREAEAQRAVAQPVAAPVTNTGAVRPAQGFFYLKPSEGSESPRGRTLREAFDVNYAALCRQLGFTGEQRDRFIGFMVEWKEKGNERYGELVKEGKGQDRALLRQELEGVNEERNAHMRATFGEGMYQAFQTYEAQSALRSLTEELARNLFHSDLPLSAPQADQLVTIMAANARNPAGKIDVVAMNNETVFAQASAVLAEPQLAAFRRVAEQRQVSEQALRRENPPK
jgi:RNA polymerase sigma factor (sigma-70 family)